MVVSELAQVKFQVRTAEVNFLTRRGCRAIDEIEEVWREESILTYVGLKAEVTP